MTENVTNVTNSTFLIELNSIVPMIILYYNMIISFDIPRLIQVVPQFVHFCLAFKIVLLPFL